MRSELGGTEDETALVKKEYPIQKIENMRDFSKSLQILRIQCRTVVPYTQPRLKKLSLDGKMTDTLVAEPNKENSNLERIGVEPGGYYRPFLDTIDIDLANSVNQKEVFPHENVHFGVSNTGIQTFENAKKILGDRISKQWESEGYPDNEGSVPGKKISPELEQMLKEEGFTPYSLYMYNSPVLKEIAKYKEIIVKLAEEKKALVDKKTNPSIVTVNKIMVRSQYNIHRILF